MQRTHWLFFGVWLFKGPALGSVGMYSNVVKNPSSVQVSMENYGIKTYPVSTHSQVCLFKYRYVPKRKCLSFLNIR